MAIVLGITLFDDLIATPSDLSTNAHSMQYGS